MAGLALAGAYVVYFVVACGLIYMMARKL